MSIPKKFYFLPKWNVADNIKFLISINSNRQVMLEKTYFLSMSFYPSICPFFCLVLCLFIFLSVLSSVCRCVHLYHFSVRLFVCLGFVYQCLSIRPSIHLSLCLSVGLSICITPCWTKCLCICKAVHLFVYLSVCLPAYVENFSFSFKLMLGEMGNLQKVN
jgi:hypothetical protein